MSTPLFAPERSPVLTPLEPSYAVAQLVSELERRDLAAVLDATTLTRAMYSTDASLYRVVPQAVAYPRSGAELVEVLDAARAVGMAVTTRGAGTSCAGNAVGPGLVVDTARHLTGIATIDPSARTAEVQPGVVQAALQAAAAPYGLRFGPDPSTHTRCTIGGMIGNNACGPRALGYGKTADNVVALDVVTGTGERLGPLLLAHAAGSVGPRPGQPGDHPDRVRDLRPAGLRLQPAAPAARARLRRRQVPGRH